MQRISSINQNLLAHPLAKSHPPGLWLRSLDAATTPVFFVAAPTVWGVPGHICHFYDDVVIQMKNKYNKFMRLK